MPVKVLEHIIKIASNEGGTVLDMFMGSGSTGVASVLLNRNFIGIEKNEEFFQISQRRLKNIDIEYAQMLEENNKEQFLQIMLF